MLQTRRYFMVQNHSRQESPGLNGGWISWVTVRGWRFFGAECWNLDRKVGEFSFISDFDGLLYGLDDE